MFRKTIILCIILFGCILIGTGCTKSEEATSKSNEKDDATKSLNDEMDNENEKNEDKDEDVNAKEKTESETMDPYSDLGNLEVWFGGEVHVSEDEIVVDGKSNLMPGTAIKSGAISGDWAVIDFQDSTTVQEDGSFSFSFPGRTSETHANLRVSTGNDDVKEHYGEHLNKVTGNHVYLTENEGKYMVKTTFEVDPRKEMPYSISLENPDWDKPDDYGKPEVWMEADYTTDHNYIYFDVKSNIMEGARVGGNMRNTSGGIIPFAYDHTRVDPDGSFQLKVRYHDLREGMYMPIKFEPDNANNDWDHLIDTYGENGEKIKGDIIKQNDNGNDYAEIRVPIVPPDLEPPEGIDITVEKEEMKLQVPDDVLFDFDESKLKSGAKGVLDGLIDDLDDLAKDTKLHINGHTDNEGDPEYNMNLSKERAESVMEYIEKNSNIADKLNIKVDGYGETEPLESNEDSEGRERNRRVEIVVNPD